MFVANVDCIAKATPKPFPRNNRLLSWRWHRRHYFNFSVILRALHCRVPLLIEGHNPDRRCLSKNAAVVATNHCILFVFFSPVVLDGNTKKGKRREAHRLKTEMQIKTLIYLGKTHVSLAKKEWW